MARRVSVAVIQIDIHLALHIGELNLMEEPFTPENKSVSLRAMRDIGVDVEDIQATVRKEYVGWLTRRLGAVLDFLERRFPGVDLVLLPEGAVPPPVLPVVAAFSSRTGAVVLAGTHTPTQLRSMRSHYESARLSTKMVDRAVSKHASKNALAVIGPESSRLVPKQLPSVFELTGLTARDDRIPTLRAIDIGLTSGDEASVLPMVCSEALQLYNVSKRTDVAAVVSYEEKPSRFVRALDKLRDNQVLPVYCNVARYGGSGVFPAADLRQPNWYLENFADGLPAEDALLVFQADVDSLAPQVGTAVPASTVSLQCLSTIAGEREPHATFARRMAEVRGLDTPEARHAALASLLQQGGCTETQRRRATHLMELEKNGVASGPEWERLGEDLVIADQASLLALESEFCALVKERLLDYFQSGVVTKPQDLSAIQGYLRSLSLRSKPQGEPSSVAISKASKQVGSPAIFDRDEEVQRVAEFLDDRRTALLEVYGLPEVGKTAMLEKAIAASGLTAGEWISLESGASPEFLLSALLGRSASSTIESLSGGVSEEITAELRTVLSSRRLTVIENVDKVTSHGAWVNPAFDEVFALLAVIATDVGAKVLIETSRRLPFDALDPTLRARLPVYGLDQQKSAFGVRILDAHLRRCGQETDALSVEEKQRLVNRLGGHPKALALAADVLADEGPGALVGSLKSRRGGAIAILRRLVESIELTESEREVVSLSMLARAPVPRSVVLSVARAADASEAVAAAIGAGCIEIRAQGRVQVSGLIAEFFDPIDIDAEQREAFHRSAHDYFLASSQDGKRLVDAVEAEFHAKIAGLSSGVLTGLSDAGLAAAQRLYDEQRFDDAIAIVNLILREKKSHDAQRLAALIEAKRGNFDVARNHAKDVFHRSPDDKWLLVQLAKDALTQFQDDEVAEIVEIARRARVEDDSLLVVQGRVLMRKGRLTEARDVFYRARDITEHNGWPFFYLGKVLYQLGDVEKSIDVFLAGERFVEGQYRQNRNLLSAIRTQLANIYVLEGNLDAAGHILGILLEDDPNNPEVIMAYAAWTLEKEGETQAHRALEKLSKAKIKNAFQKSRFHLFYAQFYSRIGNERRAAEHFRLAFRADRTNVYVMNRWAESLFDAAHRLYLDADESYRTYMEECARLVKRVLSFDAHNETAVSLMTRLRDRLNYGR